MTIGSIHCSEYQHQVQLLKDQIDNRIDLYFAEIKKRILEYKPNNPAKTSDYKLKIKVFDIIDYINQTVQDLTLSSAIDNNYDASNYLFQKLAILLNKWTREENIYFDYQQETLFVDFLRQYNPI